MNTDFWLERWSKNEIGFHQRRPNDYLVEFWPRLNLSRGSTVFVPLCGKSLDMRWLTEQGHRVLGIELARQACVDFFKEWNVEPDVSTQGTFERFSANDVTILRGDFFDLQPRDLEGVSAVFDRAALIALPAELRTRYAAKIREVLPRSTAILLITTEYAQSEMNGPPFSVSDAEVRALFAGCPIEQLAQRDVTNAPDNARFKQRGVSRLVERVYRID